MTTNKQHDSVLTIPFGSIDAPKAINIPTTAKWPLLEAVYRAVKPS